MRRDPNNQPLPMDVDEIEAAFEEVGVIPGLSNAVVFESEKPAGQEDAAGWVGIVRYPDTGRQAFVAIGFGTEDAIRDALSDAGVPSQNVRLFDG